MLVDQKGGYRLMPLSRIYHVVNQPSYRYGMYVRLQKPGMAGLIASSRSAFGINRSPQALYKRMPGLQRGDRQSEDDTLIS